MKAKKEQTTNSTSTKSGSANLRTSVLMYEQQLDKIPFDNLEALERRIKSLVESYSLKRYAYIVHDKDLTSDNEPAKRHVHVSLIFDQRVLVKSIAKAIGDNPQQFEVMTKRGNSAKRGEDNALMYLIHRTTHSLEKYQYKIEEVKANFDFSAFVQKKESELEPKDILDQLAEGKLTEVEAKEMFLERGPLVYTKYARKIEDVASAYLEIAYERWLKKMEKEKRTVRVVWLYGKAGTGKTHFAVRRAQSLKKSYFKTKSSNDPFEGYRGEKIVILDELRPESFKYQDLLQILDPKQYDKKTVARYHNANLMAEMIFVTTPFAPDVFYQKLSKRSILDSFDQLDRRIGLTLLFTETHIREMRLATNGGATGCYEMISEKENGYSSRRAEDIKFGIDDLDTLA